jgi:hypothetical protein
VKSFKYRNEIRSRSPAATIKGLLSSLESRFGSPNLDTRDLKEPIGSSFSEVKGEAFA